MKTKKTEITPETYGRTPEETLAEAQDRLAYRYRNIDGSYDLPFDDPFLYDVLVMVLRAKQ